MNTHALVDCLLEGEDIDWSADTEDPDAATGAAGALQTWESVAKKHGFRVQETFAFREYSDPTWNTMRVCITGSYSDLFPEWVTFNISREHYTAFRIPMRFLDDFLTKFEAAHKVEHERARVDRWKQGHDARSLVQRLQVAARAIMASYGLPMIKP